MRTAYGGYCQVGAKADTDKTGVNAKAGRGDNFRKPEKAASRNKPNKSRNVREKPNGSQKPESADTPRRPDKVVHDSREKPDNMTKPDGKTSDKVDKISSAPVNVGGADKGADCTGIGECASGLGCVLGACAPAKQERERCDDDGECAAGLTCYVPLYANHSLAISGCVRVLDAGAACNCSKPGNTGLTPASPLCGRGLVCSADSCKPALRLGEKCGASSKPGLCEQGTRCVVEDGKETGLCHTVMPLFSRCDLPLLTCEVGNVCSNSTGKRGDRECVKANPADKVPEKTGKAYNPVGSDEVVYDKPIRGAKTDSQPNDKTNKAANSGSGDKSPKGGKERGASCSEGECASGLGCVFGTCGTPRKEFERCDDPAECAAGLVCYTPLYANHTFGASGCVRELSAGAACNGAVSKDLTPASPLCGRGLACSADACTPAPRLGEKCGAAGKPKLCEHGTRCVVEEGKATGLCHTVMSIFSRCDLPLLTCEVGNICNRDSLVCVKPNAEG